MSHVDETYHKTQSHLAWVTRLRTLYTARNLVVVIPLLISIAFAAMYVPQHEATLASHQQKQSPAAPIQKYSASHATTESPLSPASPTPTPTITPRNSGNPSAAQVPAATSLLQGSTSGTLTAPSQSPIVTPLVNDLTPTLSPVCQTVSKTESQLHGSTLNDDTNAPNVPKCLY